MQAETRKLDGTKIVRRSIWLDEVYFESFFRQVARAGEKGALQHCREPA